MEPGNLQRVPIPPRAHTSDFSAARWKVGAAAAPIPPGPGPEWPSLLLALPGERRRLGCSRRARRASADGWAVLMGSALPLVPRRASHHFSQYFAHQLSRSLERRTRRRGKRPKGVPSRALLLGWGPTDLAPPCPPSLASGRQPPGARAAAPSRAPGSTASAGAGRREASAVEARIKSLGNRNPNAPLTTGPPDNILQKRVLRGHQSSPAPGHGHPPGSLGSWGRPGAASQGSRKLGAGPSRDPGSKRPMRPAGTRAARGGGSLRLPPSRPLRASLPAARLAEHSRGARLAAAASGWAEGAAVPEPGRPLLGAAPPSSPAGLRESERGAPAAARKRRAAVGRGWVSSATLWAQPGNGFGMRLGLERKVF